MVLPATLRGRLVAMVAALVAVTLGSVAFVSTRVAHYEIRKLVLSPATARSPRVTDLLDAYYRIHGSWTGVRPTLDRAARLAGGGIIVFDRDRHVAAASEGLLRGGQWTLEADGSLTIERRIAGGRTREILRAPRTVVRDHQGGVAGLIVILPPHQPEVVQPALPPLRSLDRWFFWTFLCATIAGILMAVAIARWISGPIERLTAAARGMEAGDLAVRVEPGGGAELAALGRAFNAMAEALARNEEQRRRLVGDVAHELRAPLTNIRCELESMQDGLTSPTPARIESLHDETMSLARLVDDLQDLALADAGQLKIDAQAVAVIGLARRAAAGIETRAREHGVVIRCGGCENEMVIADPRRAVQILTNLLANAVSHSTPQRDSAAEVRVEWERRGEEVVIRVIDRGIGIPAAELPRIFERFYRVDVSRSRATGGAGLGLSIVRQLVAAHGGRVWAESGEGAGSTFSFTLPRAAAGSAEKGTGREHPSAAVLSDGARDVT